MSKEALITELKQEIALQGPIPFVRFMEQALYHPKYGYYNSDSEKIGWKGDFYTSSTIHPIFGQLIAKQAIQMAEILQTQTFTLVEVGAGNGNLCHDILRYLQKEHGSFYKKLTYIIVEKSHTLKKQQQDRLMPLFTEHIDWADEIPQNLCGLVLSNELLDAFPIHRLRLEGQKIEEIFVDWEKDGFVERYSPPSTKRLNDYIEALQLDFKKPVACEVNLNALDWLSETADRLDHAFMLTIDYGYAARDLYNAQRPRGTFLCYHQHTVSETPYEHIGEQDMTAHVDFTALAQHGQTVGLETIGFTDQTNFLMGLGITERMEEPAKRMFESKAAQKEFLLMKQLMDPSDMGKTFKFLIQGKNVPKDIKLDGLKYKPFYSL